QVTLQTAPMQQLVTLHVTLQPRSEACARRYICSVTALPVVLETVSYVITVSHKFPTPNSHTPYACMLHTKLLHVEKKIVMAKRSSKSRPEPGSKPTREQHTHKTFQVSKKKKKKATLRAILNPCWQI
ncbi:hypothetical protein CROQUDRAFT_48739, partial [Cronartium quercuum f. sp. fusiforme G11]